MKKISITILILVGVFIALGIMSNITNFTGKTTKTCTPKTIGPYCCPDLDKDGLVSNPDYLILRNSWFSRLGDKRYNPKADINKDGIVSASDFAILRENWLKKVDCANKTIKLP